MRDDLLRAWLHVMLTTRQKRMHEDLLRELEKKFLTRVNLTNEIDGRAHGLRDENDLQSEPTYEEILQSIRRVMKEDGHTFSGHQPKVKIYRAPGWTLRHIAQFIFTKKHYERVFEPQLSDMEIEYQQALQVGAIWRARWVVIRGHGMFWATVCGQAVTSVVKIIWTSVT